MTKPRPPQLLWLTGHFNFAQTGHFRLGLASDRDDEPPLAVPHGKSSGGSNEPREPYQIKKRSHILTNCWRLKRGKDSSHSFVTDDEFKDFLEQSGNTYARETFDGGAEYRFRDRGTVFIGFAHNDDPDFLYLTCRCNVDDSVSLEKLDDMLSSLEKDVKVAKLSSYINEGDRGFQVSAEQFVDLGSMSRVFWRTIELLRSVVGDCFARLAPEAEEATTATESKQAGWIAQLETALQIGCPEQPAVPSSVPARVRAALALLMTPEGDTGSAFCVNSSAEGSLYVTNAHVVSDALEVTIYRQFPCFDKSIGRVVACGSPDETDLALVSVPASGVDPLSIYSGPVSCDAAVGVGGYPRVQLWAAEAIGEVTPAIHLGTVTSVNKSGSVIMHDALSRPGNSGGPLFDPTTGDVFGVQRGGWEAEEESVAVGPVLLKTFLNEYASRVAATIKSEPSFSHSTGEA